MPRGVRLLDADPDLGDGLSTAELTEAQRHAVVPTLALEAGPWGVDQLRRANGVNGEVHGFLLLAGAVTIEVWIDGRTCARLLGPAELILLDGSEPASIPLRWGWTVIEPTQVAILDQRLLVIARRWPGLMSAILRRGAEQLRHALLHQAISQLPRVEDRLLALLWSIADRQGVVRSDGVWVRLPITHDMLAHMIGARRPTVSLGLRALADQGMVRAHDGGWLLDHDSRDVFPAPGAPAGAPAGFAGPAHSASARRSPSAPARRAPSAAGRG